MLEAKKKKRAQFCTLGAIIGARIQREKCFFGSFLLECSRNEWIGNVPSCRALLRARALELATPPRALVGALQVEAMVGDHVRAADASGHHEEVEEAHRRCPRDRRPLRLLRPAPTGAYSRTVVIVEESELRTDILHHTERDHSQAEAGQWTRRSTPIPAARGQGSLDNSTSAREGPFPYWRSTEKKGERQQRTRRNQ